MGPQAGRMEEATQGRLAQLVRAPALQAGGPRFEPASAHHDRHLPFPEKSLSYSLRFVGLAEPGSRVRHGVLAVRRYRELEQVSLALGGRFQVSDQLLAGIDLFGCSECQVSLPDVL